MWKTIPGLQAINLRILKDWKPVELLQFQEMSLPSIFLRRLMEDLLLAIKYFQENLGYCHNPTNNTKQFKPTFVRVVLLSVKKNKNKKHRDWLHLGQF